MPVVLQVKPLVAPNVGQAIGLSVLQSLLGFFLIVPAAFGPAASGGIRRFLQTRVMVYLGTISYGIFLWHWFMLRIVGEEWLDWPLRKGHWVALLALSLPAHHCRGHVQLVRRREAHLAFRTREPPGVQARRRAATGG